MFTCDPHSLPESGICSHPVLETGTAGEKVKNSGKVTQLVAAGLSSEPSSLALEPTASQLWSEAWPSVLTTQT